MKQQEYIALVDRAKRLSYEYYVLAQPTISDAQFDALVAEIEQAEAEHPEWTLADSPTQMVGSDLQDNGRRLIRHRTRMLSCQKAQTQEAVTKWIAQTEKKLKGAQTYVLEWKYDGISCSLVYQDGALVSAATRGDKDKGQDLLAHVKQIPSVPQHINMTGRVEVRGEVLCPKAALARLGYKDCRTAAAALTNQAVPSSDMKHLVFIAWQMDSDDQPFATESMSMVTAQVHRFVGDYRECKADDMLVLLDEYAAEREALPYPTDGVVIKIDEKHVAQSLGCTEHHPKGNIAYKFSAQKAVTQVVRIEIKVGETGKRTPVAQLVPVMIMGREVSSASLYSERMMEELGVTDGCMVEVGLSNDVTPKIYRVVKTEQDVTKAAQAEPVVITESRNDDISAELEEQEQREQERLAQEARERAELLAREEAERREREEAERLAKEAAEREARERDRAERQRYREELEERRRMRRERDYGMTEFRNDEAAGRVNGVAEMRNDESGKDGTGRRLLQTAGYMAVASVVLLLIWETGLSIPLGLIGLAAGGLFR